MTSNLKKRLIPITLLAWMLGIPTLRAQEATGSVSGVILCDDNGAPARSARVVLVPITAPPSSNAAPTHPVAKQSSSSTDFNGYYEIESVVPATYLVIANLDGYRDDLQSALKALDSPSKDDQQKTLKQFPQVTVKANSDSRRDVVIFRAATISGRVTVDIGGYPGQVRVTATKISDTNSRDAPEPPQVRSDAYSLSSYIDDRGNYRITGVRSGKYRISMRLTESYFSVKVDNSVDGFTIHPGRPGIAELIVYAPDALEAANARIIQVKEPDEIADADITIPTRLLHSISGTVTQSGVPRGGIAITLRREGQSPFASDAVSMPDGRFRFDLVPAGSILLLAKPVGSATKKQTEVSVLLQDSDITGVNIDLPTGPP